MDAQALLGKTAIVTGAASGIGEVMARLFAKEGAKVMMLDILQRGRQVAEDLCREGCWARFQVCDITSFDQVQAAVNMAVQETGKLDILINVAGVVDYVGVAEVEEADWDRVIAINLKGPAITMKHAIPYMIKAGGGSIVNVSSVSSIIHRTAAMGDAYAASKAAVNGLTTSAAVKYAKNNIRCNAILPGAIETPMTSEALHEWDPRVPLRRLGQPIDVANAALFLASDYSNYITGALLPVCGGTHVQQAPSKKRNIT